MCIGTVGQFAKLLTVKWLVFGRPFVKRFTLSYQTVVSCPVMSCLWRWCIVAKSLDGSRWNLPRC